MAQPSSFSMYRSSLPQVSAADVPRLASAHDSLVIHTWAAWNNYDRKMEALLKSSNVPGVTIVGMNADDPDNFQFLRDNNVANLPCLVCVKAGSPTATRIGLFPGADELDAFLRTTFGR